MLKLFVLAVCVVLASGHEIYPGNNPLYFILFIYIHLCILHVYLKPLTVKQVILRYSIFKIKYTSTWIDLKTK